MWYPSLEIPVNHQTCGEGLSEVTQRLSRDEASWLPFIYNSRLYNARSTHAPISRLCRRLDRENAYAWGRVKCEGYGPLARHPTTSWLPTSSRGCPRIARVWESPPLSTTKQRTRVWYPCVYGIVESGRATTIYGRRSLKPGWIPAVLTACGILCIGNWAPKGALFAKKWCA